jgi:hypothetical protein
VVARVAHGGTTHPLILRPRCRDWGPAVSSRRTGHVQANICHDTQSQHRPVHLPRPGRRCRNSQRYPASITEIRSICAGRSHDETTRWLVNHLQAAVGSIPRWSTRSAPAPTVARHCHPPGVFHQFRPSSAPWSVRDTLMDELSGPEHRRPSCRRPSRHSWGATRKLALCGGCRAENAFIRAPWRGHR